MCAALIKALTVLGERSFWRIIASTVLITTATLAGLLGIAWAVLAHVSLVGIWWLDTMLDVLGGLAVVVLAWLLFPMVVTLVISVFLERLIRAVEDRHYPYLPVPTSLSLWQNIRVALQFASVTLLNLLAIPLYLLPGLNLIIFYVINAYLLGREYFELVALRRLNPRAAQRLRRAHQVQLWLAGLLIAGLLTIPVLNLLAPLLAAAFMVHIVVQLAGLQRPPAGPLVPQA